MSICTECMTHIGLHEEFCHYCGEPEVKPSVEETIAGHNRHMKKHLAFLALVMIALGVAVILADLVLFSGGAEITSYSVASFSGQNEIDMIAAAFNP